MQIDHVSRSKRGSEDNRGLVTQNKALENGNNKKVVGTFHGMTALTCI